MPSTALRPRIEALTYRLEQFAGKLNHLLDATQLQVEDVALQAEPLDLVALAREVTSDMISGVARHVTLAVVGDDTVTGEWDRLRVEQVIRNLVDNAIRFGAHNPIEVRVERAVDDRAARLVVRDRGMGIPQPDQERIFERHVRLRTANGFGLGLWIVRQLVTAMGGTVTVESSPGLGAAFTVLLPLHVER
jgi:signal transduction histidine kinase